MLTDLSISKLSPAATRREVPDGKVIGLYLIVQPSGAKSWALRYRAGGKPRKLTLGSYSTVSLGEARKKAQRALGEVADGKDPAGAKRAATVAAKAAAVASVDNVEAVVAAYVKDYLAKRAKPSWAKEAARLLRREIIPVFGKKRLGELTDDHIYKLLKDISERAPITANRTFAVFRKLCHWAMSRDGGKLIKASPCDGVGMPAQEHSRERVLSDAEIRHAWRAFETIGWPFGRLCQLLLLTGARREEVRAMQWREVDLEQAIWRLPKERTKNKRAHEIPLPPAAVAILRSLPRIERRGPDGKPRPALVFSTTGNAAPGGISLSRATLNALIVKEMREEAIAGGNDPDEVVAPDWRLHDLRRSLATNLQKLGVKLEVTEAVLNHVGGSRAGIVGIYQRHDWAAEKRQALEAWSLVLDAIVAGAAEKKIDKMREQALQFTATLKGKSDADRQSQVAQWLDRIDRGDANNVVELASARAS
jgi:integrase